MTLTEKKDAYGKDISEAEQALIENRTSPGDSPPLSLYISFQITVELRNAVSRAKKELSRIHSDKFIDLVTERLRMRRLSEESIETALLTLRKSLRK